MSRVSFTESCFTLENAPSNKNWQIKEMLECREASLQHRHSSLKSTGWSMTQLWPGTFMLTSSCRQLWLLAMRWVDHVDAAQTIQCTKFNEWLAIRVRRSPGSQIPVCVVFFWHSRIIVTVVLGSRFLPISTHCLMLSLNWSFWYKCKLVLLTFCA